MSLPLRVLAVAGQPVKWKGETRDIGAGGVCFVSPAELPVGKIIDYEITLSTAGSGARIRCFGTILRCVAGPDSWVIAATMKRYTFVRPATADSPAEDETSPGCLPGEWRPGDLMPVPSHV